MGERDSATAEQDTGHYFMPDEASDHGAAVVRPRHLEGVDGVAHPGEADVGARPAHPVCGVSADDETQRAIPEHQERSGAVDALASEQHPGTN